MGSNDFCEPLPFSISISDTRFDKTTTITIPSIKTQSKTFPPFPKMLQRRGGCESSISDIPIEITMGWSIELFLFSHVWRLLGKFYLFYLSMFP